MTIKKRWRTNNRTPQNQTPAKLIERNNQVTLLAEWERLLLGREH